MDNLPQIPFGQLLEQIGARTPIPGGGVVACSAAAMAASLALMVVAYSLGKKHLINHQDALEGASRRLQNARRLFLQLAEEDAQAYAMVNELGRLPETDERRSRQVGGVSAYEAAVRACIQIPQATMAGCCDLLRLCEELAPITNRHLHSDLAIAAIQADSAARASIWNIRVNAALLPDHPGRFDMVEQARATADECSRRRETIERACTN
jgi:formiminotetrahydrofolate cyclodeaminase